MEDYGRRVSVDMPFDLTLQETVRALENEGLDVIGQFDVRQYLGQTLHHDCRRYVLLEAVSPRIVLGALQEDLGAGAMMPITIAVFELADGETGVVVGDPFVAAVSDQGWRRTTNAALTDLGEQECEALARALGHLHKSAQLNAPTGQVAMNQCT